MRVFIGYGHNERDKWIETFAVPLVQAFGFEVVHGKAVFGGPLPEEVLRSIRSSDAMIGFTTRRDPAGPDTFGTHPWVVQELLMALAQDPRIPFVEVREQGVLAPGGALEAYNDQHIAYREADRAMCLLQIAQALRRFSEQTSVITVRLGPASVVEKISPFLDDESLICRCQVLQGATRLPPQVLQVLPIKGSLFVKLQRMAGGELVRITISAGGQTWRSDFESVDTVDIQLK